MNSPGMRAGITTGGGSGINRPADQTAPHHDGWVHWCRRGAAGRRRRPDMTTPEETPPKATRLVFISHATVDREWANAISKRLEADEISCWIAPRNIPPGADYAQSI